MLAKVRWPRTIGAIAPLFITGMVFLALGSFGLHYVRLWLAEGEQCIIFAPDSSRETRYGDACDQSTSLEMGNSPERRHAAIARFTSSSSTSRLPSMIGEKNTVRR